MVDVAVANEGDIERTNKFMGTSTTLWVEPLAKAAVVAGADGIMVEVHSDPANAKCDGQQSIKPEKFRAMMKDITLMADSLKKAN